MTAPPESGLDTGGRLDEVARCGVFPDGRWKSNFLCTLGYGSDEKLFPRNPRLDFDEACVDR